MTKEELIIEMTQINNIDDTEIRHDRLDKVLLEYINDTEVSLLFRARPAWYA